MAATAIEAAVEYAMAGHGASAARQGRAYRQREVFLARRSTSLAPADGPNELAAIVPVQESQAGGPDIIRRLSSASPASRNYDLH